MRKLGSLKLHNSVAMSDSELKNIVGGWEPTTPPGGTGTPASGCFGATKETCDGACMFDNGETTGDCVWKDDKCMCIAEEEC